MVSARTKKIWCLALAFFAVLLLPKIALADACDPNACMLQPDCASLFGVVVFGATGCTGQDICCTIAKQLGPVSNTPSTSAAPAAAPAAGVSTPSGGMNLVSCVTNGSGDCTIEDVVKQGVYFAQFIMGLSGSLFLIVFIYGGAMYLMSFGRSGWVEKGKKAMIQSAIGIVLVMGAWTIVNYVATSIGYSGSGGTGASTPTDQTAQCANDATSMKGCVKTSDKCLDWCNQVFIETSLSSSQVAGNCSDGPANACTAGQKCCVLKK